MGDQVDNVRAIKDSIASVLEIIRAHYDADVAAVFLLMKDMDDDERLEIFERRLGSVIRAHEIAKKPLIAPLTTYWRKYRGKRENLRRYIKNIEVLKFCFREVQNPDITSRKRYPGREGKIWQYDYLNRPEKYVIFLKRKGGTTAPPIIGEGLTAYSIRTNQEICCGTSSKIAAHPSTAHLQLSAGISDPCCAIALLHLKDPDTGKLLGLVRIENYAPLPKAEAKFRLDSKETEAVGHAVPILARLVKKSRKFYEDDSYEKLYGGIRLLDLLREMPLNPGSLNALIYGQTHHLFCVLKRKEYVGHAEIMSRVTKYADQLASQILKVSSRGFFEKMLERRRKHEDLMLYQTDSYRDHFMHQFHVFVTGYIILNHLGIEKIGDNIRATLSKAEATLDVRPDLIDNDSVLRIWFLCSFMHDAAYVFERFAEGISNFFRIEWGKKFPVELSGVQMLGRDKPFGRYLERMLRLFVCEEGTECGMLPTCLDSIIRLDDHGVLSALWLIETFAKERPRKTVDECYLAALAICFHNPKVFKELKEGRETGLSFEAFPIPFLLAYCDTVQTWGRERNLRDQVHCGLADAEFASDAVTFMILFESEIPDRIYTRQQIRKWFVEERDSYFRSKDCMFTIEFYRGEPGSSDRKSIDEVPFKFERPMKKDSMDDAAASVDSAGPSI